MVSWARRLGWLRSGMLLDDLARRHLEAAYLGGHTTLFPEDAVEVETVRGRIGQLATDGGLDAAEGPTDEEVQGRCHGLLGRA